MPKTNKQKEREIKYQLGKCRKCPFLEIRNVDEGKVYCFYKLGHICIAEMVEEMRGNNDNSRQENRGINTIRKKSKK